MEVLEKIRLQLQEFLEKKKALLAEIQKDFPELFKPLFAQSKKIKSIGWTQYTQGWNDGEECTFSVYQDYLYVNGDHEDDIDSLKKSVSAIITTENISEHKAFNSSANGYKWYADKTIGERGNFPNPDFDTDLYEEINTFKSLLSVIPEELYKDLFEDHVKVTMHHDGSIDTEEYEHD